MDTHSIATWAVREFGWATFNDERLTKRGTQIATDLLAHPHSSIPQACRDWAATKATYRFFANKKVTAKAMLYAHQYQLRQRAGDHETVLVAQDTMTLNLSGRQIAGLGSIGDGGHNSQLQGLYVHSGLAMDTDGLPLGLTSQKVYARKAETRTAAYRKTIKAKPITEKETYRWVEAVTQAHRALPDKHLVVIGDRESDIYEVFQQGQALGVDLLVRTSQNRVLQGDKTGQPVRLFDAAREGTIVTTYETEVPVNAHTTRPATLTIRAAAFQLPPPTSRDRGKQRPSIPLTVVGVTEEQPPQDAEPIHWLLTSSLPVTTPEQAIQKVAWYMYRWRIERFHYTLKAGAFTIEGLQLKTFERFANAIALYSVVAVRVLQSLYLSRACPDEPARTLFSDDELTVLAQRQNKTAADLTIQEATKAVAQLGGYLARKRDGPPGIKALWEGFRALQYMVEGMWLGRARDVGKG